ncbi:MAG: hypothetical protein P0111_10455 [Nitrospira sp.]|nr:hypothetical protein [Nitrospira sp.]
MIVVVAVAMMLGVGGMPLDARAATTEDFHGAIVQQRAVAPSRQETSSPQAPTDPAVTPINAAGKDCDGQPPSAGSITAMLRRLVDTSANVRGVQCPIPPIPDSQPIQEPQP